MIVRAVYVHEPFANAGKRGERGRRTVDELAVRSRAGERALEDELIIFARFKAVLFQKTFQRRAKFFHIEHGLDGAAFFAAADERAVGAFAEDEIQRAEDDGLARAGFARDDVATGLEFQREVAHEGEVFDVQRRQHWQIRTQLCGLAEGCANRKVLPARTDGLQLQPPMFRRKVKQTSRSIPFSLKTYEDAFCP